MKSLRELYKIGKGPSSSHTMGPQKAAQIFAAQNEGAISFSVTLYGSLAATGKGHMTDVAIEEVLTPPCTHHHCVGTHQVFAIPPQRNDFQRHSCQRSS